MRGQPEYEVATYLLPRVDDPHEETLERYLNDGWEIKFVTAYGGYSVLYTLVRDVTYDDGAP